jgi:glycosyltransferase involved in cell wall biosynthesis
MVLVFESLFSGQWEGGAQWLESLLMALGLLSDPPSCLIWGIAPEDLPANLQKAAHVKAVRGEAPRRLSLLRDLMRRIRRQSWEHPGLTALATNYGVDLWVGFCGFEGLGKNRRLLVWYPDFQYRYYPELFPSEELAGRKRQWDFLVRRAQGFLMSSDWVAHDARKNPETAGKLHVCGTPPPTFSGSMLEISSEETRSRYHLPERFFLGCNQFWQHKNHLLVLRALKDLRQRGETPPVVAFTGRPYDYRNPNVLSDILGYVAKNGLHEHCRILGLVPRSDQVALIRAAEAIIQPSRYEGRDLISEEAWLLGTPLLYSDIPVHREMNIPGGAFFPVDGASELANLLRQSQTHPLKPPQAIHADCGRTALAFAQRFEGICQGILANEG